MPARSGRLPESETEWLETSKFRIESVAVNGKRIRCALTKGARDGRLVTMVGGIPREVERRAKLPLINKLYGQLALLLLESGVSSLLYNQPATGGSTGDWNRETLTTRTKVLVELVNHFGKKCQFSDYGLIGSSSGAYMAVSAAGELEKKKLEVSKLLLLSPAAYPEAIETVPYGEKFTEILRQPWDVTTSPVFGKLQKLVEKEVSLLLCFFEHDDPPIPLFIQEYYRSLVWKLEEEGAGVSVVTIPGVAHNFRRIQKRRGSLIDDDSVRATAAKFREFFVSPTLTQALDL